MIKTVNFQLNLQITLPASLKKKTLGLCGYWDGNKANDWFVSKKDVKLTNFVSSLADKSIRGLLRENYLFNVKTP